jgi:imidazoleglycerol-phosphate dehydratase
MTAGARQATIRRDTAETKIALSVNLDGTGVAQVETGVPFFDHMLTLLARHALIDLTVKAEGDTAVDYHHTVEDVGIVLGSAIKQALGDKAGIRRYGFFLLPMDETLARCVLDLSNRAMLVYQVDVTNYMVRDFNICLVREFFQGLANSLAANVHLRLEYGEEPHHVAEALFKAFARSLRVALEVDPRQGGRVPSTKGTLA